MSDQDTWDRVAARFVAARRSATPLADYPGPLPGTLANAYAIQRSAIRQRGGVIGGWKVGRIQEPLASELGTNRLAGPIFADRICAATSTFEMPVIAGGFAAAEAEFLLRLDHVPAGDPIDDDALKACVGRVAIGIEIASSPFGGINDHGPAVTVSDFGNNNGLLIGPDLPPAAWDELTSIPVSLAINGAEVGAATAATMLDGPWGALRFIIDAAGREGLALEAGQWISTGAVTGVHRVVAGDRVSARFGDAPPVETVISNDLSVREDARASA